jgi:hypothetical protein
MRRKTVEFVQAGKYAAEVPAEVIEQEDSWSPRLTLDDARKLERVRLALQSGDIKSAARDGRVFELLPISA